MNEALIAALSLAIGGIITALFNGWTNMKKANVEIDKTVRDSVIEEWREITNTLQGRVKLQEDEIKAMRTQIVELHTELATLRAQIASRETERIVQRGEIRTLEKSVTEMKKPDPEAIAQAIMPKLAEALSGSSPAITGKSTQETNPIPVVVVKSQEPIPVVVKSEKD